MADLDFGRKNDLEMLAEAMKNARSTSEKEHYEKIAHRIVTESTEIGVLRADLIQAVRASDKRAIRMIEARIQKIRQDETYGKSWGNNKGEGTIN